MLPLIIGQHATQQAVTDHRNENYLSVKSTTSTLNGIARNTPCLGPAGHQNTFIRINDVICIEITLGELNI